MKISYDYEKSVEYLRRIQKRTNTLRETVDLYPGPKNTQEYTKLVEEAAFLQEFLPTEYESDLSYYVIFPALVHINALMSASDKTDYMQPVIGTITTFGIDAFSYYDEDISVIVISRFVLYFFRFFALVIADLFVENEANNGYKIPIHKTNEAQDKYIHDKLIKMDYINKYYVDYICSFVLCGNLNIIKHYPIKNDYMGDLAGRILQVTAHFIVAHEYAHIYYNHPFKNEITNDLYRETPYIMEDEADSFAIVMSKIRFDEEDGSSRFWMIGIALMVLDMLSNTRSYYSTIQFNPNKDLYRPFRQNIYAYELNEYINKGLDYKQLILARMCQTVFKTLYENNNEKIKRLILKYNGINADYVKIQEEIYND